MLSGSNKTLRIVRSHFVSMSSLRTLDAKALAASLTVLAILCAYRFYSYWTTGFFVSDEYGYFFDALHGYVYSDRWFVGWVNIYLFKALGITSVDAFSYLLPFYMFFWTAITFVVFYKLLKLLEFNETTVALSLVSCFVLISFVLLSLGFLTEPVGLCMAMSGIYCLARVLKTKSAAGFIGFAFLACCFFGFAAGTREPYEAFLIAGGLIVLAIAVSRRKEAIGTRRFGTRAVLAVSVLAFVVPAAFFLVVPTQAYSTQVAPLSTQILQSVTSNPQTSSPVTTETVTSAVTVNNTVTVNGITSISSTVTTTTIVRTSTESVPFYRQFVLTNTLLIFFGGLVLGWGPVCFAIGLAGLLILFQRAVRRSDVTARFVLLTSLTALGSYLIVSFIYAPDPYYFSFQDYSTVIRFSDTALPAYFLVAPFFLSILVKNRKRMVGLAAVCIAFLLIAVPVYQVYAASNFNYTSQNPFDLGYRSDAVALRDYFAANDSHQIVDLIGVPYGWTFTPGVQDLHVQAYAIGQNPLTQEITLAQFSYVKWSVFYLFRTTPPTAFPTEDSFLAQVFDTNATFSVTSGPSFTVLGVQPVLHGSDFTLYEVQLRWS